jgi:hypothetical protein
VRDIVDALLDFLNMAATNLANATVTIDWSATNILDQLLAYVDMQTALAI